MHNACFELCCSLLQLKVFYILLHLLCAHAELFRSGETCHPQCKIKLHMHWGSVRGCSVQAVTSEVALAELRLCPSAGGHLAMQAQCGTPETQLFSKRARQRFELSPPCATLLGPVVNDCHLLGYTFLPEQPFLMKAEPCGLWVYKVCGMTYRRLVVFWLGM